MKLARFAFVLSGLQGLAGVRIAHLIETDGLLVDPGSPGHLAAAIDRLLGDASLARTLGARAQARATAEFHVSRMVERYASLYRDALDRSSP